MAALIPFLMVLAAAPLLAAAERAVLDRDPMRVIVCGVPALLILWIALCVTLLGLIP